MHGPDWYPDGGPIPPKRVKRECRHLDDWEFEFLVCLVCAVAICMIAVYVACVGERP
jgi:hypothetical protein